MHIVCSICQFRLECDDNITTSCGHVFHKSCLCANNCFIEKSRECPECKTCMDSKDLIDTFIDYSNENDLSLEKKVYELYKCLQSKKFDIQMIKKENNILKKSNDNISNNIEKMKKENTLIHEIIKLQNKLKLYPNVSKMYEASQNDAKQIEVKYTDAATLSRYVTEMKREFSIVIDKNRRLRNMVMSLKQDLLVTEQERNNCDAYLQQIALLESKLKTLRSEKENIKEEVTTLKRKRTKHH